MGSQAAKSSRDRTAQQRAWRFFYLNFFSEISSVLFFLFPTKIAKIDKEKFKS